MKKLAVFFFCLLGVLFIKIIEFSFEIFFNNILYTIYSCGCNAAANSCSSQNNVIVPLEAVVTLVN